MIMCLEYILLGDWMNWRYMFKVKEETTYFQNVNISIHVPKAKHIRQCP